MSEVVISIPKELEREFGKSDPFLLQLALQRLVKERLEEFIEVERTLSRKSKLTEAQALELGKKVTKSLAKRYENLR